MRALQTHDVFKAMRIVNALGVKEEIQKMAFSLNDGKELSDKEVGYEIIINLIANAGNEKTEHLIYEFLGGPLEMDPEEIKVMDPLDLVKAIQELNSYVDLESWKVFFKSVASMMK